MTLVKSYVLSDRMITFAFRCVLFLLLGFFVLYRVETQTQPIWISLTLLGLYFVSNGVLLAIPVRWMKHWYGTATLFLLDTGIISWIIYASGGLDSDLYLAYFLVVFMSGIQMKMWQSFLVGTVGSGLYVALWFHAHEPLEMMDTIFLLRIPFFYIVSFFTAFFAERVRSQEDRLRHEYEEKVAQAERRIVVGQFASRIAFELNNPLSVIIGFAGTLQKRLGENDPLNLPARSVEREATRCRELVKNLMVLSEGAACTFDFVDLNAIVRDALARFEETGRSSHARIRIESDLEDSLPTLYGDRRQIFEGLLHLLRNAQDAMPTGGIVAVRTHRDPDAEPGKVHCEIEDSGVGMSEDFQQKIFDPLAATKEGRPGLGLGLIFVLTMVRRHRGTLRVSSRPGRGTKVSLSFPAEKEVLAEEPKARAA